MIRRLALCLTLMGGAAAAEPVDAVLTGGPIYTGEGRVAALAWSKGRIVYAGDAAGLSALDMDANTRRIDLNGAAAFPGFVDAHAHLSGIGERELTLTLEGTGSLAALQDALAAWLRDRPGTSPVIGRGWIETHWPDARFPTAADLDAVAPDRPVFLVRADGHAGVANSAALKTAGISGQTDDPSGGEILRDDRGRPTGMLIDKAMGLLAPVLAEAESVSAATALATGAQVYAARGWTGVHNMSVPMAQVPVMEELAAAGRMPIRVYNAVDRGDAPALLTGPIPRVGARGLVVTRAIKLYADGALGSRGAALLAPYSDRPDSRGLLLSERADTLPILTQALEKGAQIAFHAIGDRANRLVLDWFAQAFDAVPADARAVADPRWRIEHAQVIAPADLPRLAQMGVIASMQPSHAIGDLHFAPDRLGPDRLAGAYAWAHLVRTGATVAGGSDAPVERGDPRIEFYATVARRDLSGYQGPGWHGEQALDRATALKLFTLWPAYAAFAEGDRGTLAVGKQADISVFSKDLMTVPQEQILAAEPLMTVVGGHVVHDRLSGQTDRPH